jgi:hypothetical protein
MKSWTKLQLTEQLTEQSELTDPTELAAWYDFMLLRHTYTKKGNLKVTRFVKSVLLCLKTSYKPNQNYLV